MKKSLLMATLVVSTLVFAQNDEWKSMGEQLYVQKGCAGCHGVAGVGASAPRLAGLNPEYIIKQLKNFQEGTRSNLTMEVIAWQVEGVESMVAAYLASRTVKENYYGF